MIKRDGKSRHSTGYKVERDKENTRAKGKYRRSDYNQNGIFYLPVSVLLVTEKSLKHNITPK